MYEILFNLILFGMSIEVYKPIENIEEKKDNKVKKEFFDFENLDGPLKKLLYNEGKNSTYEQRQEKFNELLDDKIEELELEKNREIWLVIDGFKWKLKSILSILEDTWKKLLNENKEGEKIGKNDWNKIETPIMSAKYWEYKDIVENMSFKNKDIVIELINNHEVLPEMEIWEKKWDNSKYMNILKDTGKDLLNINREEDGRKNIDKDMEVMFKNYLYANVQTYNSSGLTSSSQLEDSFKKNSLESLDQIKTGEEKTLGTIDPNKKYFSAWNIKIVWSKLIYMWSDKPGREEITLVVMDPEKKEVSKIVFVIDILDVSIENTPENVSGLETNV